MAEAADVASPASPAPPPPRHDRLDRFDDGVDAFVDAHRSPVLDHVAYGLSSAADHSLLWFALMSVRAARTGDVRWLVQTAAAQGVESFVTNIGVKALFRRVRPPDFPDAEARDLPYGLHVPITSSFPSGHATAAFTAAAFMSAGARGPVRVGWYGLAAAVAASRVYVRMHRASDVIGGAALGVAFGAALRRVGRPSR